MAIVWVVLGLGVLAAFIWYGDVCLRRERETGANLASGGQTPDDIERRVIERTNAAVQAALPGMAESIYAEAFAEAARRYGVQDTPAATAPAAPAAPLMSWAPPVADDTPTERLPVWWAVKSDVAEECHYATTDAGAVTEHLRAHPGAMVQAVTPARMRAA